MYKGGQHTAFALQFHKVGLFINALKAVVGQMRERLFAQQANGAAEMAEGLAAAGEVCAVGSGRDAESGEALLWLETIDSGSFSFRLNDRAISELAEAVRQHETAATDNGSETEPTLQPHSGAR